MNETLKSWKREPLVGKWQYFCLLVVAVVELMYMSPQAQKNGLAWVAVDYFLEIPAMVFLLLTIARGIRRQGWSTMLLSLVMLLWIALVQVMRVIRGLEQINPGEITCFYALALPLAFAMEDGERQWGLKTLALVYLLEGLRLCLLAGALYFGILPEGYRASVLWDGARLLEMFHPTNCSALLLISIGLCLGLCLKTNKRWLQGVLIVWILIQFGVQTLTNGRTGTVFTCLLIGAALFCGIRKTGWKRAPLALAAGIVVMAVLFLGSQKLFSAHQKQMTQSVQQTQSAEESGQAQEQVQQPQQINAQRSFLQDMFSFNGRTAIWKAAVKGLAENPKIMVCGTDNVAEVLAPNMTFNALHTHNPFLEVIYVLGIPGLVLALLITVLAFRGAFIILWRNTDLWKSAVALSVLCLFGCGLLEPYLFVAKNNQHYLSIFFLTGVGYLHQWTTGKQK
ncbi:MAG: O-antigen ligase family protein [Candidatus Faecousia sp.]|nr:O-antigen ligase family protein [Candidatus Faecousia sp.]